MLTRIFLPFFCFSAVFVVSVHADPGSEVLPGEADTTVSDTSAPNSSAVAAPEAIPAPTVQPPPPTVPVAPDTNFNWRRDKDREPNAIDSTGPGAATTEAGISP